jgi:hypothetical protein
MPDYPAIAGLTTIIGVTITAGVMIAYLSIKYKERIGIWALRAVILLAGILIAAIGSAMMGLWFTYLYLGSAG